MLRLRGGAKKRKKKSYTTPKKNKHKRKKVKLAVLKYYKVVENRPADQILFFLAFLFFGRQTCSFDVFSCRWMRMAKSTG